MDNFITLTCPSCGGKLQITDDIDRFACGYCGAEHIVKRSGGIVAIAPVVEGIKKVQAGVDKTAAELAIIRISKEIDDISKEITHISNEISYLSKEMEAKSSSRIAFGYVVITMAGILSILFVLIMTANKLAVLISGFVVCIVLIVAFSTMVHMSKKNLKQNQQFDPLLTKKRKKLNQKQQELRQKYQELEQHKKTVSL